MEVVVTTGARSRAKLQPNHHHQQTNIQFFTGRMPFLSHFCFTSFIQGLLEIRPDTSKVSKEESLGIAGMRFLYGLDVLPVTQPTAAKR